MSVTEILGAKLLMVLVVTALAGLPYLAVVFALLITLGVADAAVVPALLAPFAAAVICSTAFSLVLTLLARDFRTANNLDAVLFVPLLALTVAILGVVAGPARTYVLSLVLLIIAVAAVVVAMRWITFERYLE